MTPFKQGGRKSFRDMDEMDAESVEQSVGSPPPPKSSFRPSARSRLFQTDDDDDDDDDDNFSFTLQVEDQKTGKTPARNSIGKGQKILKPVDLNLSLEEEDTENEDTQGLPNCNNRTGDGGYYASIHAQNSHQQRHKRFQKYTGINSHKTGTPVRSYYGDSDTSMATSPYISPSSYITMDGRCVTSKNPFSPMITEDSKPKAAPLSAAAAAPSFPVSFDNYDNSERASNGISLPPICRHRLQKREGTPSKRSFLYGSLSRDGYPEQQGRYSFTGSPIKEDEEMMPTASPSMMAAHKIRRLGIQDDVHHYPGGRRKNKANHLMVDIQSETSSSNTSFEEVSPTDIMSFPAPPTPTKSKKVMSPYPRTSNPPETPFLSRSQRRSRRRGPDGGRNSNDFDDTSIFTSEDSSSAKVTPSRFKSDFDIISELGKGSFGAVYKVLSRLDGCCYAVKTAHRQVKGNADRDRMLKEVYALSALSDQNGTWSNICLQHLSCSLPLPFAFLKVSMSHLYFLF